MHTIIHKFTRVVVVFALFVLVEFALPLDAKSAAMPLVARRDAMQSRLLQTPVPERDICQIRYCGPTFVVVKSSRVVVTAYSSTPDQTSGDPFITASGTRVHKGTFAMNGVPIGTKLRIPDYYGDQIFVVEDRMSSRYSSNRGDIWMETRQEAKQWGVRSVEIHFLTEVL